MTKRHALILGAIVVSAAIGLLIWFGNKPRESSLHSDEVPGRLPPRLGPDRTAQPKPRAAPGANRSAGRNFSKIGASELEAFVAELKKRDLPSIMQIWLDARRADNDLTKQGVVASTLATVMAQRPSSAEFLAEMRQFINNSGNERREREELIGILISVGSKETVDLLLELASTLADERLRHMAVVGIGRLDKAGGNEEISPALERVWRSCSDHELLSFLGVAMAKAGTPSGIELMLSNALDENGTDEVRKRAALRALREVYTRNAVPALAACLNNHAPASEAGQLASATLVQIGDATAGEALVAWLRNTTQDATPLIHELVKQTGRPGMMKAWNAALDSRVSFSNDQNREAIRAGLEQIRPTH